APIAAGRMSFIPRTRWICSANSFLPDFRKKRAASGRHAPRPAHHEMRGAVGVSQACKIGCAPIDFDRHAWRVTQNDAQWRGSLEGPPGVGRGDIVKQALAA